MRHFLKNAVLNRVHIKVAVTEYLGQELSHALSGNVNLDANFF